MEKNIIWHGAKVTRQHLEKWNGHKACIIWFTGLSGAGKSTVAYALEEALHQLMYRTFVLDGNNVRHGLSSDLSFSDEDRRENVRRIGEVSKLMLEAGMIVMTAFISPFRADRDMARRLVPHGDFIEVYCRASLDVCEARAVKGFYKKARMGEIRNYTEIDSPYEEPPTPNLVIDAETTPLNECVNAILTIIKYQNIIPSTTTSAVMKNHHNKSKDQL